jgi:hypothetical protein
VAGLDSCRRSVSSASRSGSRAPSVLIIIIIWSLSVAVVGFGDGGCVRVGVRACPCVGAWVRTYVCVHASE